MLDGEDIIVDTGTYVYTPYPEWRNKFRSTAFHNTIEIGDIEQNDISRNLFEMCQAVECRNCRLDETEDMIVFEGEVKYLDADIIHSREVILYKHTGTFKIFDKIKSLLPCKVLINLCLGNCGANYHISLDKGMFEEAEGFYSKGYGDKTKAVFLRNVTEGCSGFAKETTVRR
jgi:hypothetical protein